MYDLRSSMDNKIINLIHTYPKMFGSIVLTKAIFIWSNLKLLF